MILFLLLLQIASPAPPPPHDALHYDITLIPSDTGSHVLGEVQITWRLGSTEPIRMQLDSSMRVIRVLVDGKPNTRLSRTRYARSFTEVEVPHQKQAGDTLSTRVRYRGYPRDGLIIGKNARGDRTVFADNRPDRVKYWLPTLDFPGDKATVSFHIQVPLSYQVMADGALEKIDTLAYDKAIWHYSLERPVPVHTAKVGWVSGDTNSVSGER
jgi:aminopeptidase N